jgi:hypothetical protein
MVATMERYGQARPSGSNSVVECQLPKLDVAGSSPVSRSIDPTTYKTRFHSEHRLNTVYITRRLFSSWFTMSSLLSTGDCV